MSTAESWMRDALGLADQVLDAGEGELVGMGDFGDVEFMVCPPFFHSSYVLFCALQDELYGRSPLADADVQIDTLHQSTHAALQFTNQSQKFLDGIFTSLNNDLKQKERIPTNEESDPSQLLRPSTTKGRGKMDPIHMLRALANSESSEEVLTTVASVPPVLGLATPRRGTTPGRGITPKRTGSGGE
jgi:kinetochore protein Mis13/DSN1